jgi:hypothetical protein
MAEPITTFVGLDAHKVHIQVAVLPGVSEALVFRPRDAGKYAPMIADNATG